MNCLDMFKTHFILVLVLCLLSSFFYYQKLNKCARQNVQNGISDTTEAKETILQVKINKIFKQIDQTIPEMKATIKSRVTSAKDSKVFLENPKSSYCAGENIILRVEMFDYQGNKKTYGGDYLRARMFTPELEASSSGRIEDFHNGTYHVHFTLFWQGYVKISIFLMHPSEASSTLWTYRNKWHGYVKHFGRFTMQQQTKEVECGLELNKTQELCEYKDQRDEEYFYCVKPQNFSCDSLSDVMSMLNSKKTLLTEFDRSLLNKSNIRVEIPKDFEYINVLSCNNSTTNVKEICTTGKKLEYPSGYAMKGVWHPKACSMLQYDHLENLGKCMQGKFIYLFGDSTVRQWIIYIKKQVKTLKEFHLYDDNWAKQILLDLQNNMKITWKRHTFPFISNSYQSWKEERTTAREIDLIRGDQRTVIVIDIGKHFRSYPIQYYIRRLLNIRSAIDRLFLRSPQTKVIIKTENTSSMRGQIETTSDFHGFVHYSIIETIFTDIRFGFVNGWDMTNAFDTNEIHPPEVVISNEVQMLMTYIC